METLIKSVRDPLISTMGGCITPNSSDLQSDIESDRDRYEEAGNEEETRSG